MSTGEIKKKPLAYPQKHLIHTHRKKIKILQNIQTIPQKCGSRMLRHGRDQQQPFYYYISILDDRYVYPHIKMSITFGYKRGGKISIHSIFLSLFLLTTVYLFFFKSYFSHFITTSFPFFVHPIS